MMPARLPVGVTPTGELLEVDLHAYPTVLVAGDDAGRVAETSLMLAAAAAEAGHVLVATGDGYGSLGTVATGDAADVLEGMAELAEDRRRVLRQHAALHWAGLPEPVRARLRPITVLVPQATTESVPAGNVHRVEVALTRLASERRAGIHLHLTHTGPDTGPWDGALAATVWTGGLSSAPRLVTAGEGGVRCEPLRHIANRLVSDV